MPLTINNRSVVIRMRLLMKLVLLFCLLTVVYQFSQCSSLSRPSESKRSSLKLPYLQLLREQRSVEKKKLAPYNDIVGIASTNVPAYSNGNDSYYSNENSFLNGIYMGLKWQCVEYARRWTYIRKSSVFPSIPGAADIWNQLTYVERVSDKAQFPLKHHPNGSPKLPINETYLIYQVQKDMPFGHVAVIVDVLPNAIRVAEQNFNFYYWRRNYARQIPLVYQDGLYYIKDEYEVYGWIEIDDNQELLPLEESTGRKIEIENQRILNNGTTRSLLNNRVYIYYFLLFFGFIFYYMFC